jgi:hypothetical protein
MYIYDSTNQGLYHPSFKSLIFAINIWFPTVEQKCRMNFEFEYSANSKQNLKNVVYETGAQIGLIGKKKKPEDENLTLLLYQTKGQI